MYITNIEWIPDFLTMQRIEYHPNGKIKEISFRSPDEIGKLMELIPEKAKEYLFNWKLHSYYSKDKK